MSVHMMTSLETFEAYNAAVAAGLADEDGFVEGKKVKIVRDYHGHEEGVHHDRTCPHHGKARAGTDKALSPECIRTRYYEEGRYSARIDADGNWIMGEDSLPLKADRYDACRTMGPLYMEESWKGRVLHTGERNGYHDSDFTVNVWTGTEVSTFIYASTRGWTYPNGAVNDATPEVREQYNAWMEAREQAYKESRYLSQLKATFEKEHAPMKGSWVIGTNPRARNFRKGMTGMVLWMSEEGDRVGISVDGSKNAEGRMNLVFSPVEATRSRNMQAILEDEEGWDARPEWAVELEASMQRAAEVREERRVSAVEASQNLPHNAWVRVINGKHEGKEGLAFYSRQSDGLVGLALDNSKCGSRYSNTVWVKATQLEQDESAKPGWARRYKVRG